MRPGRSDRRAPAGPRRPHASARRGRRPLAVPLLAVAVPALALAVAVPVLVPGPASPSPLDARTWEGAGARLAPPSGGDAASPPGRRVVAVRSGGPEGETWPGRVLITNDDGIDAEPTRALARAFAASAETWVVAPSRNRSGSGSHVSALSTGRFEVERRELGDGITAYAVDGYPGDAVAFALLGPMRDRPPDLVVSGINGGPNLGGAWFLSGTVGAARVAAFLGVPALAVSGVDVERPGAVEAVAGWVVALARSAPVRRMEPGEYLTVSLPAPDSRSIRGLELAHRAHGFLRFEATPVEVAGPEGEGPGRTGPGRRDAARREAWALRVVTAEPREAEGTDVGVVAGGRIAVVPMRVGEEDGALRKRLEALADSLPGWPRR